jgi:hypothetical protein
MCAGKPAFPVVAVGARAYVSRLLSAPTPEGADECRTMHQGATLHPYGLHVHDGVCVGFKGRGTLAGQQQRMSSGACSSVRGTRHRTACTA